jgi:hypothetical protein
MKLTETKLRQLVREEASKMITERRESMDFEMLPEQIKEGFEEVFKRQPKLRRYMVDVVETNRSYEVRFETVLNRGAVMALPEIGKFDSIRSGGEMQIVVTFRK